MFLLRIVWVNFLNRFNEQLESVSMSSWLLATCSWHDSVNYVILNLYESR